MQDLRDEEEHEDAREAEEGDRAAEEEPVVKEVVGQVEHQVQHAHSEEGLILVQLIKL